VITVSIIKQQQKSVKDYSADQAAAFAECISFSGEHALIGHAGTGKTYLLGAVANWHQSKGIKVHVTASTHKAAAVLSEKMDYDVATYHSVCGLRVSFDASTGQMKLTLKGKSKIEYRSLWIIDEASMISHEELKHVRNAARAKSARVLFVGDPYQLAPVKGIGSPALTQPKHSRLTTLHRQADDNPLLDSTHAFREVLEGFPFPDITERYSHGQGVQVLDRDAWNSKRLDYYSADNDHDHVRSLYFTNEAVIEATTLLHKHCTGRTSPVVGDWLVINSALEQNNKLVFSTDEWVKVESVSQDIEHGLNGYRCRLVGRNRVSVFIPANWDDAKELLKACKKRAQVLQKLCKAGEDRDSERRKAWREYYLLKNTLVDARQPYACTVHKSQGSTYDYVFIDLDDIGKCTVPDTIARLLYVAFSRPREAVFVTGSLPERLDTHNRGLINA
jgi:ATP-dependent exoDNAse (exonuclease V) alpha subunit